MARPKHRTQQGATYFVTTNTWQRRGLFRSPEIASIVEDAIFRYRDASDYRVHGHVVMPDHLHIILTPGKSTSLEKAVQLMKGGSSREIGKRPGMRFPVWHEGFTEHQIRDRGDFDSHVKYIDENPVKAGLAATPNEYLHGSAAGRFVLDPWPVASGAEAQAKPQPFSAGLKPRPSDATPRSSSEAAAERASGARARIVSDATPRSSSEAAAENASGARAGSVSDATPRSPSKAGPGSPSGPGPRDAKP
jgi:putative transposase